MTFSPGVRGWTVVHRVLHGEYAFSPGVRGWTDVMAGLGRIVEVFPRRAGVDRDTRSDLRLTETFPPAYGGGPSQAPVLTSTPPFSPGVRGWTEPDGGAVLAPRRFPPLCGGGPWGPDWMEFDSPFPPACGGGPRWPILSPVQGRFSPVVRGWTVAGFRSVQGSHVFPRCAGVDRRRRQ